jgi:hypothetical protein
MRRDNIIQIGELAQKVKRNPTVLLFIPVLIAIVITAVFLASAINSDEDGKALLSQEFGDSAPIDVLPETRRPYEGGISRDPFQTGEMSAAMALGGVVTGEDGFAAAIISVSDASYVVCIGEQVGQTGWTVADISSDAVALTLDEKTRTLQIADDDTDT